MDNKIFRILTIDGGGIRGVFAAHFLRMMQQELKVNFYKDFDLIAGTSTGSIVAAGLAIDSPIEKLVDLYRVEGKKIFARRYSPFLNF